VPDPIVRDAWERRLNSPQSSAAGRLFDAAAALVLGLGETSFEGQGPMWLEAIAGHANRVPRLPLQVGTAGLITVDWAPLIEWLLQERARPAAERAGAVHASLATAIVDVAATLSERTGNRTVGLTGGVFQNRRLSELAHAQLLDAGFDVLLPERIPCNDGGLSYGQVADFAGRSD
jgi:hydrogenase maturation protein HypF